MSEEFIQSVMTLCEKLSARLDEMESRLAKKEEHYEREVYSQAEIAKMTGWSKSTIQHWISKGWISAVPGSGKCLMVPAGEIKKILAEKGRGKFYGKQAS